MVKDFMAFKLIEGFKDKVFKEDKVSQQDIKDLESKIGSNVITSYLRLPRFTIESTSTGVKELKSHLLGLLNTPEKYEQTAGLLSVMGSRSDYSGFAKVSPYNMFIDFLKTVLRSFEAYKFIVKGPNATSKSFEDYFFLKDLDSYVYEYNKKLGDLTVNEFLKLLVGRVSYETSDVFKIVKIPNDKAYETIVKMLSSWSVPHLDSIPGLDLGFILLYNVGMLNFRKATDGSANVGSYLRTKFGKKGLTTEEYGIIDGAYFQSVLAKECIVHPVVAETLYDDLILISGADVTLYGLRYMVDVYSKLYFKDSDLLYRMDTWISYLTTSEGIAVHKELFDRELRIEWGDFGYQDGRNMSTKADQIWEPVDQRYIREILVTMFRKSYENGDLWSKDMKEDSPVKYLFKLLSCLKDEFKDK